MLINGQPKGRGLKTAGLVCMCTEVSCCFVSNADDDEEIAHIYKMDVMSSDSQRVETVQMNNFFLGEGLANQPQQKDSNVTAERS